MKQEHIEKIEAFLQTKITRSELEEYAVNEGLLDLDEKIEWVENTILAIEADGVKEQLKELLSQKVKPEVKVRSLTSIRWIAGIAASLIFLLSAYWGMQKLDTSSITYAKYEYQEPGLPVTMSQSENYALYDALTYFGEGNYTKSILKLEAIEGERSDTISYYLGASYYYKNDFDKVYEHLSVIKIQEGVFSEEAEWLLVLSYLKDDEKQNAIRLLDKIIKNSGHKFYKKATNLKVNI